MLLSRVCEICNKELRTKNLAGEAQQYSGKSKINIFDSDLFEE
jgi:hypothetical protein